MPLSKEHKEKSREKILESASALFSQKGFEGVSIDDVMKRAGMTRGAFYAHFSSKEDLYAHALRNVSEQSAIVQAYFEGVRGKEFMDLMINGYLSDRHLKKESPCPLASLATDVATSNQKIRSVYTEIFSNFVNAMERESTPEKKQKQQDLMLAISAMMIGGVAVGRALVDQELTDRLLASCRTLAHELIS